MQKFLRTLMLAALLLPFASQAQTLPFTEGFGTSIPTGWTMYTGLASSVFNGTAPTSATYGWNFGGNNGLTDNHARVNIYGTSCNKWLVTPSIALTGLTSASLSFDLAFTAYTGATAAATSNIADDKFMVIISTDDGATWSAANATKWMITDSVTAGVADYDLTALPYTDYQTFYVDLTSYIGSTIKIAFYAESTVTGGDNNLHLDNVYVGEAITCFSVSGLTVSAATDNSLTLSWADALNTGATYSVIGADGSVVATGITATTYTVTGLNANTVYTYGVVANCSATDAANAVIITGRTECAATTALPYAEDFSGYTGLPSYPYSGPAVTPSCWDYYSNGTNTAATTSSAYYGTVATYNGTSSYGSMVSNDPYLAMPIQLTGSSVTNSTYIGYGTARGSVKYAVLPAFAESLSSLQISFDYKMTSTYSASGAASVLELGYITSDTSSFVSIWNHNSTTTLQHVTEMSLATVAAAAPAGARLAFKFSGVHNGTSTSSYSTVWAGIDNIVVEALPSCFRVNPLTVAAKTSSTMTLSWVSENTGATFSVYNMADASLVANNIADTFYTVTGLTANTAYTFGVVAHCSATDESDTTTVSGRTDCAPEELPFTEDFSATLANDQCWRGASNATAAQVFAGTALTLTTPSSWTYASAARDGLEAGHYYKNVYGSSGKNWMITPAIDLTTAASAQLSFDVALTDYNNAALPDAYGDTNTSQAFMVIVSTDGGNTWSATNATVWQNVDGANYTYASLASTTYQNKVINLNQYLGQTIKIAFYCQSLWTGGDNDLHIDNIAVTEVPSCMPVTSLTADSITAHEAMLTWIGEASSYNVYDMSDTTLITTVYNTVVNLTNLTADASHTIGVTAVCGSEESDTVTVTFRTLVSCPAPTGLAVTLTPGDGTVADINWVHGGEESSWEICLNNDLANTIIVSDTAYSFTSLTAEQAYTVKVRAICGAGDTSAWTAPIIFTPTNAYSITVADSTATNGYVPVYGFYADAYLRSQIVYPAADLAAMTYGAINSLTFYSTDANVNWGSANFKVYLTETTDATISSFTAATSMTNVYEGALSISGNQMVVTFTTPYTYMGGNLLVAVDNTVTGDYVSCTWLGINSNGSSVQGYNYSSLDGVTPTQRDFIPKATFSYIPGTAPACLPVTGLTAVNVTADSATLTWNSTGSSSYTVIDMSDSSYVASVTDTFYVLTGLTAMTSYTYGVAAECSSDNSDTIPVSFATACGIVTLPYTEGFEATSAPRGCWTTDGPGSWSFAAGDYSTSTGAFEGSVNAKINHSSEGNVTKLISPVLDLNGATGVQLTYAHIQRAWAGDIDELRVYYRTSATDTWTVVAAYTNEVATWTVDQVMLPATTYQVAFEMTDGYGYGVAVDSVVFTPLSADFCFPVTDLTVESVTATSATISWTGTGAANYSVYNGAAYVASTTDTFYTFTGLTATTDYTFGVRALCSATDSSSLETVAGRTDCVGGSCNITIASGNYGFLGASIDVIQNGDTLATVSDGFTQSPYTESVNVCSGVPVTLVYNASPYGYDSYVSFTVSDGGNTVVYTCTDASTLTDGAVFTTIASACPSCMPAQNLTVDSADLTSVSISWTGNAASYDVYNGTTFVANVTTNNYTFTGLTASTSYTFGVQAICSATDSANMATINAMTACADVTTLPYTESFENGLGCWSTVNGSADGQPWFAYDCAGLSGITPHHGLYVASSWSWNSSAMHANAWLISPKFVLPTVAAGDTLNFNWWHITNGSYPDSYSVVLSTTTNDTAAFTTVLRAHGQADSTWTMQTVDLTAYAGQSVYIAFHHVDYNENYLLIDEISLALGAAPVPAPDTMTVTFAVNDATMGTTNPAPGTYQYLSGDTVRFEANANNGYVFTGWNLTIGTQSLTSSSISVYFTVNDMLRYGNTVNVTANFEPGTPDSTTITYAVNDPTLGTTNPAPGTYTIYVGDSITASATAYTGSVLAAWAYDIMLNGAVYRSDTIFSTDPEFANPIYIGRLPQSFVDAGASIVITAIFEDEDPGTTYYTITGVANDPDMGYVLGSNRYAAGSEVVLTAVANNGYRFVRWSNGETTATITFTATENVELTAFFEVDNTGIEDANMANVSIYSTDNKIVVRGAEGQSIYVFDLNGRVMASENNAAESVEFRMQTTGVYLVKVGTAAAKRVVLMR